MFWSHIYKLKSISINYEYNLVEQRRLQIEEEVGDSRLRRGIVAIPAATTDSLWRWRCFFRWHASMWWWWFQHVGQRWSEARWVSVFGPAVCLLGLGFWCFFSSFRLGRFMDRVICFFLIIISKTAKKKKNTT